ncbi:hypothetical protein WMF37_30305 [Sorangium sp. So ce291]|uniref:hypothetical protein n=1 Tax=Sorangium sp. So ce291 TaxID=3133294 RepID=UPI003F5FBDBC
MLPLCALGRVNAALHVLTGALLPMSTLQGSFLSSRAGRAPPRREGRPWVAAWVVHEAPGRLLGCRSHQRGE